MAVLFAILSSLSLTTQAAPTAQARPWAWGSNEDGQLGGGTTRTLPAPVGGALQDVTGIGAGFFHSVALLRDGTVWAWGGNNCGQLGNGTRDSTNAPIQVSGLHSVIRIGTGAPSRSNLAIKQDGSLWEWGYSVYNNQATCMLIPQQVREPNGNGTFSDAIDVATGDEHKIVLKRDGTVWAWGNNGSGQLGNGGIDPSLTPVQVPGLTNIIKIIAGGTHTLALKRDGTVWGWGLNSSGQLGDGTTTLFRRTPVQVLGPSGAGVLSSIIDIAAGQEFSLAVRNDGTVWAWGGNFFRQLGNSNASYGANPTPVQVEGPDGVGVLTDIIDVTAGNEHSLARSENGEIWGWGKNEHGELGNGLSGSSSNSPVLAQGICGATAIAAGNRHSLALMDQPCTYVFLSLIYK